jgi:hypothetical protein
MFSTRTGSLSEENKHWSFEWFQEKILVLNETHAVMT